MGDNFRAREREKRTLQPPSLLLSFYLCAVSSLPLYTYHCVHVYTYCTAHCCHESASTCLVPSSLLAETVSHATHRGCGLLAGEREWKRRKWPRKSLGNGGGRGKGGVGGGGVGRRGDPISVAGGGGSPHLSFPAGNYFSWKEEEEARRKRNEKRFSLFLPP